MSALKVGDICVGRNHVVDLEFNGRQCSIIRGFDWYLVINSSIGPNCQEQGFIVAWDDGVETFAARHQLRKIDPPATDTGEIRQATLDVIERARRGAEVPA